MQDPFCRYVVGIPFYYRRYTKGLPFLSIIVYKRVRVETSSRGEASPYKMFWVLTPPPGSMAWDCAILSHEIPTWIHYPLSTIHPQPMQEKWFIKKLQSIRTSLTDSMTRIIITVVDRSQTCHSQRLDIFNIHYLGNAVFNAIQGLSSEGFILDAIVSSLL